MDLPKKVIETKPFHRAWNMLLDYLRSWQLQSSDDILVNHNTHGTSLKIVNKGKSNNVSYEYWDENKGYSANTIVWVEPNKSYSTATFFPNTASVPLAAGTFICCNSVPPIISGSRPSGNIYYPIYPTIPSSSVVTVSGSIKNQTFWNPITPMKPFTMCKGKNPETVFISSIVSGSTFDLSKLPYP